MEKNISTHLGFMIQMPRVGHKLLPNTEICSLKHQPPRFGKESITCTILYKTFNIVTNFYGISGYIKCLQYHEPAHTFNSKFGRYITNPKFIDTYFTQIYVVGGFDKVNTL